MSTPMLICRGLTRRFGDFTAVDQLDFEVAKGKICVFLGPNGAGKSTTLKMLTGLLEPTAGAVTIGGVPPSACKASIGVLPENLGLFDDLTIEEHLHLTADDYSLTRNDANPRIDQLIRVLQLEAGRKRLASQCSHGMRKKTSFAMALLHDPQVLFLDEPFEAIDPVTAKLMFDVLATASSHGVTVFLTSHILSLVERLGHQFVLIRAGRMVLDTTKSGPLEKSLEQTYFDLVEEPITEELAWLGASARS